MTVPQAPQGTVTPARPRAVRRVHGSPGHIASYRIVNSIFFNPPYADALEASVSLNLPTFMRPSVEGRLVQQHQVPGIFETLLQTLLSIPGCQHRLLNSKEEKEALFLQIENQQTAWTSRGLQAMMTELRMMVNGALADLPRLATDPWVETLARIKGIQCEDKALMLKEVLICAGTYVTLITGNPQLELEAAGKVAFVFAWNVLRDTMYEFGEVARLG